MLPISQTWRLSGIGLMRIAFGIVWAIDAQFKWRPGFLFHFSSFLTAGQAGQPDWIRAWIQLWLDLVNVAPVFFAVIVAIVETLLAIALLFGLMTNIACFGGFLLVMVIWTTAEGFGGPYTTGATDIGTSIIYALVFAILFFARAGLYHGFDRVLSERLGPWAWLASGRPST